MEVEEEDVDSKMTEFLSDESDEYHEDDLPGNNLIKTLWSVIDN